MEKVILRHGYISIPNYTLGDNIRFENMLSIYDEIYHSYKPIAYYYEEELNELRVPAGIGVNTVAKMLRREPDVDYASDEARKAIVTLKKEPRNQLQKELIGFMAGEGAFRCNAKYPQICVVAGTGEGKTYCAIAALTFLRVVTMVIVPTSTLRGQWKSKVKEYTQLTDSDIMIIDSSAKMDKLLNHKGPIKYKLFSATHDVLESYARNNSWIALGTFFTAMGIGCNIIDEVHKDFGNTIKILTHTNCKKTFVLTATFKRSEFKQNKLFQLCFANTPKYIQKERDGVDSDSQKHITGLMVIYDSRPSLAMELSCEGPKGLDRFKYANYLVERDMEFFNVLGVYLTYFAVKCGAKTMIFCGSINACEVVANYAANVCTDKVIGVYNSKVKMKQEEKDKILEVSDVIVTTSNSLGEGKDLDGLHCIINFEAYRSEVASEQNPGRLRKLMNDDKPYYYIEIINKGFKKAFNQYKARKKIFDGNFGTIKIRDLTKKR